MIHSDHARHVAVDSQLQFYAVPFPQRVSLVTIFYLGLSTFISDRCHKLSLRLWMNDTEVFIWPG